NPRLLLLLFPPHRCCFLFTAGSSCCCRPSSSPATAPPLPPHRRWLLPPFFLSPVAAVFPLPAAVAAVSSSPLLCFVFSLRHRKPCEFISLSGHLVLGFDDEDTLILQVNRQIGRQNPDDIF
ncbi:hypothetical protein Ccrd_015388, partial [Cynara cardunculus var. scolymus]